jgi:predicted Zn-dependent peptidase
MLNEIVAFGLADPESSVVELAIQYPTDAGLGQDPAARLILTEMLNRRAQTLRDKLGSSYTVVAKLRSNVGSGAYVLAGEVDPVRAGESLTALRSAVSGLATDPDFTTSFALARQAVLRDLLAGATSSADIRDQLVQLAIHRLPSTWYDDIVHAVASATPDQVKAAIAREIRPERELIGAIGQRDVLQQMFQSANVPKAAIIE